MLLSHWPQTIPILILLAFFKKVFSFIKEMSNRKLLKESAALYLQRGIRWQTRRFFDGCSTISQSVWIG